MAISWYTVNSYVKIGLDFNVTSTTNSSVTMSPKIYRWDSANTDNYGSTFSIVINPDSNNNYNSYTNSGNTWGSGSGERVVREFGVPRVYERRSTAYTVTITVNADSSFGTYYSGSFHTLGAKSKSWTYTIPAAPATTCTVSFNANGGSVSTTSKTVTVGSTYGTLPTPTLSGYSFLGWYTSSSGGSQVTSSTTVSSSSNHTLYAHWQQDVTYYSVYMYNDSGSLWDSLTTTSGGKVTLPSTGPTKSGYTFSHWATAGGVPYYKNEQVTLNSNLYLYPQWAANITYYYVYLYPNDGTSGYWDYITQQTGYSTTLPTTTPTRAGYTFSHWNTNSNGTGTRYNAGATVSGSMNLYAIWDASYYYVNLSLNDGSSGYWDSISQQTGSNATLPTTKPTKAGYTFLHWNTNANGTGTSYNAGATVNGGMTLYAIWKPTSIIAVYDSSGAKRTGYVVAYDSSGVKREVVINVYDSSGALRNVT